MKKIYLILISINFLISSFSASAGGGNFPSRPLKEPLIKVDGKPDDWYKALNEKAPGLIHLKHEQTGIEFFTVDYKREYFNEIFGIRTDRLSGFLVKVPKTSDLKEASIIIRGIENEQLYQTDQRYYGPNGMKLKNMSKKTTNLSQFLIKRGLKTDYINVDWINPNNNDQYIEDIRGRFDGNLYMGAKEFYADDGRRFFKSYYPISNLKIGVSSAAHASSYDDDEYEYFELASAKLDYVYPGIRLENRMYLTLAFDSNTHDTALIAANVLPSVTRSNSTRQKRAAICDPNCPYETYEALDTLGQNGLSVQVSVTAQVDHATATLSVTSNFDEILADVALGGSVDQDYELEVGVAVYSTDDLDAITEGISMTGEFDFKPIAGVGAVAITNDDADFLGLGLTYGFTGKPGLGFAGGYGVDGGGGTSESTNTPPTTSNGGTSTNSGSGGSGGSDSGNDWSQDDDRWGHDDDHGAGYGGGNDNDNDWGHDDDDNSGYF